MTQSTPRFKLVIAGGSGYLGQAFARHLDHHAPEDWRTVILSRSRPDGLPTRVRHVSWDGRTTGNWAEELRDCTHVLNLAGRSVDCRKTPARCDEILRSRIESTLALGQASEKSGTRPMFGFR